jgi:RNA polymerase sigma-70 factor (ECF subfamily)
VSELKPETWPELYGDYLTTFAYMRVSDRDLAQDLVQDTFFSALRAKDNFQGKASEKTWLISILKNKIIDFYRKTGLKDAEGNRMSGKKNVSLENFFQEGQWKEGTRPLKWDSDLNHPVETNEFFEIFNSCVNKLKGKGAIAFKMKYIDQEDSEVICETLNITPSNYWVLIHRAKLQLRECLNKNYFDEIANA